MGSVTRGGRIWEPEFLVAINGETCIGCGRCFKVCGRNVMKLKGLTHEQELVELDGDGLDDDDGRSGRLHRLRCLRAGVSAQLSDPRRRAATLGVTRRNEAPLGISAHVPVPHHSGC